MSVEILNTLTTLRDYMRWGASRFAQSEIAFGQGTINALDEAVALVLHTVHQPYNLSESYFNAVLTQEERQAVFNMIERRITERLPIAYLTNVSIFAGLAFYVDERVLVPRSPIAELIAQRFAPWVDENAVTRILDCCTGSGCIAIACAYAFPDALVDAIDLSRDALDVAQINVKKHQLEHSVALHQSDLFNHLPQVKYDIIVSNPPYVAEEEWQNLSAEFHAEPDMAFKGGHSGLDLVWRILIDANDFLSHDGILVVEVGSSAENLLEACPDVPFYWLEFENGGDGVFLLTAEQVKEHHATFVEQLAITNHSK